MRVAPLRLKQGVTIPSESHRMTAQRTSLDIERDLHDSIKKLATREGRPIRFLYEDALRLYLRTDALRSPISDLAEQTRHSLALLERQAIERMNSALTDAARRTVEAVSADIAAANADRTSDADELLGVMTKIFEAMNATLGNLNHVASRFGVFSQPSATGSASTDDMRQRLLDASKRA
ncbi:hypothetical protein [Pseudomarimonas arenosa]|uniref:Uncharacterized protein n=1 Tax=Pseudomarimonas arenosa TaxID=2774145 RepID=A0AAW3ZH69_9GAMM|nr:hypothetical protein [Pseudomarimonas arenosa]MBD8524114.1 hypothetical protein [Pseudomarimonas arenosa]